MQFRSIRVEAHTLRIPTTGSATSALIVRHGDFDEATLRELEKGKGRIYGAFVVWCRFLRPCALMSAQTPVFTPRDVFQELVLAFLSGESWREVIARHRHKVYRSSEPLTLVRGKSRKGALRVSNFRLPYGAIGRTGKEPRNYSGKLTSLDKWNHVSENTKAQIRHALLCRIAGRTLKLSTCAKYAQNLVNSAT